MKILVFDIGGMSIKYAVCENSNIICRDSISTQVGKEASEIIQDMSSAAKGLLVKNNIKLEEILCIGVGIPGIESKEGYVYCTNLYWHKIPLRDELQRWINKPIFICNDANLAALAEHTLGVCKGSAISLTITIGTGLGGGIIIDNKVFSGSHGFAGEIGHFPLVAGGRKCSCNIKGCFEKYASAAAMNEMTKQAIKKNPDSLLAQRAREGAEATGKLTMECVRVKDKTALKVFNKYIYYLAMGITGLVNIFDPEIVALGGGLSAAKEMLEPLRKKVDQLRMFNIIPGVKIELAQMGNDAGLIGAGIYALQNYKV